MSDLPDDFVPDYDPLIWGGTKGIGDWQDKYVQMCRIANEQAAEIERLTFCYKNHLQGIAGLEEELKFRIANCEEIEEHLKEAKQRITELEIAEQDALDINEQLLAENSRLRAAIEVAKAALKGG